MSYTIPITKEMVTARTTIYASRKDAVNICRQINRKKFKRARTYLEELLGQKIDIRRKYHTKAAINVYKLLDSLAANAKARSIEPDQMKLMIAVHRGPTLHRGRRKAKFGTQMKIAHVQAVLMK